jgi:ubiquinone/menaquinone biosynthesis C-methylase UbiE
MTTEQVKAGFFVEAHFVFGLAPIVLDELQDRLKHKLRRLPTDSPDIIRFALIDDLTTLNQIRTVTAFYVGYCYAIPRPKALLGHSHFQQLLKQLTLVQRADRAFRSFRIEAAGSESTVFRRLAQEIAKATNLINDPAGGELVIRVFPTQGGIAQWVVLCRLTPRPLSARTWRVADLPGALNATIAAAMNLLSNPKPTDRFLNLMCGSGTLLIERLLCERAHLTVGCDISTMALASAERNIQAAGLAGQVRLLNEDATRLPFLPQSFDVLVADLPWGQLVGGHRQNEALYPLLLQEAARVASPAARFVLITNEIRLFEQTLQQTAHLWRLCATIRLNFKNVRPRIYLLERSP